VYKKRTILFRYTGAYYNICKFAGSPRGRKYTKTQKKEMREKMIGKKNPFYGKTHSEETRKKISNSLKGKMKGVLIGEKNPMFGKDHTEKNKNIMSESSKSFWNSDVGEKMKSIRSKKLTGKSNPFTLKGKLHPRYNPEIYYFYNNNSNESFSGTVYDFRKMYNLCGDIYYLVNKKYKQYKGWVIKNK
jgi:group I intron endonuclease